MKLKAAVNSILRHVWLISPLSRGTTCDKIEKAIWLGRFSRWCKENECPVSSWRPAIYEDLHRTELKDSPITYLEFGTHQGRSMRWWLDLCANNESRFVGFDTFEGLPEAWEGFSRGHFSTQSNIPDINDSRCSFVKGLFQETLPEFLKTYKPVGRQIIHVDADLFSSALFVLNQIGPLLRPNDVLIFDEFHVWMDEFRAFQFFLRVFQIKYDVIFRSPDWSQTVIRVREA